MAKQARKRVAAAADEPNVSIGRLEGMLRFRMKRLSKLLSDQFGQASSSYNLNSGELTALAIIEANPGVAQVVLSRQLNMDEAVIVAVVDALEKREWAERRRNPDDRRRHSLYITSKGKDALDDMCKLIRDAEDPLLEALAPEDRERLFAILDQIDNKLRLQH